MIKNLRLAAIAAFSLSLATPLPALAQESPLRDGDYVEVSMIKVDDGQGLRYAQYLADTWRKVQEHAKQQGWISGYEIWTNQYARDGEADLWLITYTPQLVDAAEGQRRDRLYREFVQQSLAQLEASSGQRAEYRHLAGSMLMRRQNWAN